MNPAEGHFSLFRPPSLSFINLVHFYPCLFSFILVLSNNFSINDRRFKNYTEKCPHSSRSFHRLHCHLIGESDFLKFIEI